MTDEQLILVDESNRATGSGGKTAVHRAGLLHRAFSIFVVDDRGRNPPAAAQSEKISLGRTVGEFLLRASASGRADRHRGAAKAQRGARRQQRSDVRLFLALPDRARQRHARERIRLRLFRAAGLLAAARPGRGFGRRAALGRGDQPPARAAAGLRSQSGSGIISRIIAPTSRGLRRPPSAMPGDLRVRAARACDRARRSLPTRGGAAVLRLSWSSCALLAG